MDPKHLRAHFASAALQAFLSKDQERWTRSQDSLRELAHTCWRVSDALMQTRPKEVVDD